MSWSAYGNLHVDMVDMVDMVEEAEWPNERLEFPIDTGSLPF